MRFFTKSSMHRNVCEQVHVCVCVCLSVSSYCSIICQTPAYVAGAQSFVMPVCLLVCEMNLVLISEVASSSVVS